MRNVLVFCLLLLFHIGVLAQTPTTDLFDGWGKNVVSIYEENDRISVGALNGRDENYSQGLRFEALWEETEKNQSRVFDFTNISLKNSFNKLTIEFRLNSENKVEKIYSTNKFLDSMYSKETPPKTSNSGSYWKLKDQKLKNEEVYINDLSYINSKNGLFLTIFKNKIENSDADKSINEAVSIIKANEANFVCHISFLTSEKGNQKLCLVWLKPYNYDRYVKFICRVPDSVTNSKIISSNIVSLSGFACTDNLYPFSPIDSVFESDLEKLIDYEDRIENNKDGLKIMRGFSFGQFIYTSPILSNAGKFNDVIDFRKNVGEQYRPSVGNIFIGFLSHSQRKATNEYIFSETRIGLWGPLAFSKETQGAMHGAIAYIDNPAWKYQIKPSFPVFLQSNFYYRKDFITNVTGLKIGYILGAEVGNIHINSSIGLLIKGGAFSESRYAKAGYVLPTCSPREWLNVIFTKHIKYYYYVKPSVTLVGINGLLTSTFASRDSEKLLSKDQLNSAFIQMEGGFGLGIGKNLSIAYTAVARSAEYIGQAPNINWGRILIRIDM